MFFAAHGLEGKSKLRSRAEGRFVKLPNETADGVGKAVAEKKGQAVLSRFQKRLHIVGVVKQNIIGIRDTRRKARSGKLSAVDPKPIEAGCGEGEGGFFG